MRFIVFCLLCPIAALGQTFDTYGGWEQSPCSGGATGNFYTEKVSSRWWFCTPLGNHFWFEGVGGTYPTQLASGIITSKYGTQTAWETAQLNFFKSLKFNAVGELTESSMFAPTASVKLPFVETILQSNYATVNLNSYASRAIKNYV